MNRTVKWHQLTPEQALGVQKSDASCGLTARSVGSRIRKVGWNASFHLPVRIFSRLGGRILKDPAFWLAAGSTLLSFCFGTWVDGVSCLLFLGIWMGILAAQIQKRESRAAFFARYRQPTATVLRESKPIRVLAKNLVPGDVVILQVGDIVPADCKLLASEGLTIRRWEEKDGKPIPILQAKDAKVVYPPHSDLAPVDCENLILTGSDVVAGLAKALVIRTNSVTDACLLRPQSDREEPRVVSSWCPMLRAVGFVGLALILPILLLSLWLSPKDFGLFHLFLPLCALALTASGALLLTEIESLSLETFDSIPSVIPSRIRAVDRLSEITDLLVIGNSPFSNGVWRADRVASGWGSEACSAEKPNPAFLPLAEAFWIRSEAKRRRPAGTFLQISPDREDEKELAAASGLDEQALRIRFERAQIRADETDSLLDVNEKACRYQLQFFEGLPSLADCDYYWQGEALCPLSDAAKLMLRHDAEEAEASAETLQTVLRVEEGKKSLLGILFLKTAFLPHLTETLCNLEKCGIRTTVMFPQSPDEIASFASRAGLSESPCDAESVEAGGFSLFDLSDRTRVFANVTPKRAENFVRQMKKDGKKVAVWTDLMAFESSLAVASLRISTAQIPYPARELQTGFLASFASRFRLPDLLRRDADLLIAPPNGNAGGLASFARAAQESDLFARRLAFGFRWELRSFLLRAWAVLLCVLLGGAMAGWQVFSLGLLSWVGLLLSNRARPDKRLQGAAEWGKTSLRADSFFPLLLCDRVGWIRLAFPTLLFSILAIVLRTTGWMPASSVSFFLFSSAILTGALRLFSESRQAQMVLPKRSWAVLGISVGVLALSTGLSWLFPTAGTSLGMTFGSLILPIAIPMEALLTYLCAALFNRAFR